MQIQNIMLITFISTFALYLTFLLLGFLLRGKNIKAQKLDE